MSKFLDFDSPIYIFEDGCWSMHDSYAPDLPSWEECCGSSYYDGWTFVKGLSNQAGGGDDWLMHPSEYVDESIIPTLLDKYGEGVYVAVIVPSDNEDEDAAGWAILFRNN